MYGMNTQAVVQLRAQCKAYEMFTAAIPNVYLDYKLQNSLSMITHASHQF